MFFTFESGNIYPVLAWCVYRVSRDPVITSAEITVDWEKEDRKKYVFENYLLDYMYGQFLL